MVSGDTFFRGFHPSLNFSFKAFFWTAHAGRGFLGLGFVDLDRLVSSAVSFSALAGGAVE